MTDEESDPATPDNGDGTHDPPGDARPDATDPSAADTPPDDDDPSANAAEDAPTGDSSATTDPYTTDGTDAPAQNPPTDTTDQPDDQAAGHLSDREGKSNPASESEREDESESGGESERPGNGEGTSPRDRESETKRANRSASKSENERTDEGGAADTTSESAGGDTHDLWAPDEEYEPMSADEPPANSGAVPDADTQGGGAAAGADGTKSDGAAGASDASTTTTDTAEAGPDELAPAPDQLSAEDTYTFLRPARRKLAAYLNRTGLKVVKTTWLRPPFCYGAILREPKTGDLRYHVVEPELSPAEATLRDDLEDQLRDELLFRSPEGAGEPSAGTAAGDRSAAGGTGGAFQEAGDAWAGGTGAGGRAGSEGAAAASNPTDAGAGTGGDQSRAATLRSAVQRIVNKYDLAVDDQSLRKITYYLIRDWIHTGIADPLLQDPRIEEVSCDGDGIPIYVYHRDYESLQTNRSFETGELRPYVTKLAQRAGRDLSIANPLEGAALPDGSRVELTLGEVTERGPTFTIRKFKEDPFTPPDLVRLGTFSPRTLAYLWEAIANGLSVLVVGGTASGKTTTLNAVSLCVPPKTKIVSIEDTRELKLPHTNWVPHVTREGYTEGSGIGMQTLLRHSLRQRPQLIVVGEVRGEEAGVLFQSMNTGHQALSTLHADSLRGLISRLENPPMAVERELISELDLVVIQAQVSIDEERVRRCTQIAELYELDPETRDLQTRTIFEWDEPSDAIREVAESRQMDALAERGREPYSAIENRAEVFEYLVENDITAHQPVADVMQTYDLVPDLIQTQIAEDTLDIEEIRAIRERALSADTQAPSESNLCGGDADAAADTGE